MLCEKTNPIEYPPPVHIHSDRGAAPTVPNTQLLNTQLLPPTFKHVNAALCLALCSVSVVLVAIAPTRAQPASLTAQVQNESIVDGSTEESDLEQSLPQDELEVFATAFAQLVELREAAKSELADVISSEELTPEQFLDIRNGNTDDVEQEELERFARAEGEVNRVRSNLEQDMQQAVEDEGMTVDRFQEIFAAVEDTPELQARLQQVWEERL